MHQKLTTSQATTHYVMVVNLVVLTCPLSFDHYYYYFKFHTCLLLLLLTHFHPFLSTRAKAQRILAIFCFIDPKTQRAVTRLAACQRSPLSIARAHSMRPLFARKNPFRKSFLCVLKETRRILIDRASLSIERPGCPYVRGRLFLSHVIKVGDSIDRFVFATTDIRVCV